MIKAKQENTLNTKLKKTSFLTPSFDADIAQKVAQISDPLWKRICEQVLHTLGAQAFADLWQVKIDIAGIESKQVRLSCPNQEIVKTIKNYQFVILDALKAYFPMLKEVQIRVMRTYKLDKVLKKDLFLKAS